VRRTRLIWFAAGLFVAAAANFSAKWLIKSSARISNDQYIVVSDRQELREDVAFPKGQIVETNPRILRECGVRNFVVWQPERWVADGPGVTSGFKPSEQSDTSVTCVLNAVADRKVFARLQSAAHPNDLARDVIQAKKQEAAPKNAKTH
jgi:hypothetical protein